MKVIIMSLIAGLLSLAAVAQSTFEGALTVNYEVAKDGKASKSQLGLLVKASKVVIDPGKGSGAEKIIINTTSGDIHVLTDQNGRKAALKLNQKNIAELGGLSTVVNTYGVTNDEGNAKVTATSEYKEIQGYKCRLYKIESDTYTTDAWITNELGFNLGSVFEGAGALSDDAFKDGMILAGSGKNKKTGESYKMSVDVDAKDIPADEVKVSTEYMVMDISAMIQTMLQQNNPEEVKKMLMKMVQQ